MRSGLLLNRQKELEFGRKLLFGIKSVWKIYSTDPAVCMDLHSQRLNVIRPIGPARKIWKVELDLIPALVKSHWHCTNERLYSRGWLIIGGSKSSSHIFVIKDLHFKGEIFFKLLRALHFWWSWRGKAALCLESF